MNIFSLWNLKKKRIFLDHHSYYLSICISFFITNLPKTWWYKTRTIVSLWFWDGFRWAVLLLLLAGLAPVAAVCPGGVSGELVALGWLQARVWIWGRLLARVGEVVCLQQASLHLQAEAGFIGAAGEGKPCVFSLFS